MFNKQKKYFVKKATAVQNMIWDLEFKRFKTLEIRESIRKEYDNLRSKLEVLQTQIKSEKDKPSLSKDEFRRLEDQEVLINKDIERMKAQMSGLDLEVQGSKPTAELPEGHTGINNQLDALRELLIMINEYRKVI